MHDIGYLASVDLTAIQQAAFDAIPVEQRLAPNAGQTRQQRWNFTIASFRAACDFDGIGTPSVEAVEAALQVAAVAGSGSSSTSVASQ